MSWPWKYGERQYLPPDDLPEDFSEGQDDDEDEDLFLPRKTINADQTAK